MIGNRRKLVPERFDLLDSASLRVIVDISGSFERRPLFYLG
jgi:hypothetical protein